MKKDDVLKKDSLILRILEVKGRNCLVIDCVKKTMPKWIKQSELESFVESEYSLISRKLDETEKRIMNQRFTMISSILPLVSCKEERNREIAAISEEQGVTKQTVRKYLCEYLAYQNIEALAPMSREQKKELSQDEKNMRWALNKFFYTTAKNTLKTAYTLLLKNKYCDSTGNLFSEYPSFYQFRYFYRQTKKLQNYYISRNGLTDYQRNNRPCTGNGVQEFASMAGVGMLDSTICDIYLVDEAGGIVGRPILTACVDAYSSMCCGYSLSWEGGVYSLRNLMLNVVTDKAEHCKSFGISIKDKEWDCNSLPAKLVTDMGSEYASDTFSQISELGITLVNLPPYRPELKGPVEKFFDLIQGYFKPYLKGKGLIEPDFQERGAVDYRKEACLTMEEFEKIILHCIIFYNSQRILENFQYSEEMLNAGIKPYANCIWNWSVENKSANLIGVDREQLILCLLPRVTGKFSRYGLKVNKMRYHNENYNEQYLQGKDVTVAYNPDDVTYVWLIENGAYVRFELIESRFKGRELEEVQGMQDSQNTLLNGAKKGRIQAEIALADHIQAIAGNRQRKPENKALGSIRQNRQRAQRENHRDMMKEVAVNE